LHSVGPRPIALASTIDLEGIPNLAPFSFYNIFSANPPILIFSPSRSGRTGESKDTYNNVKTTGEVVINAVNYSIVHQVNLSSCPYPPNVNEFIKSGFTPLKSEIVKPFRVAESPVQFECKVNNIIELGNGGGSGNLIICEILKIHVQDKILDDKGMIDPFKIDLVSRMGGNWYNSSNKNSMFEITKPLTTCGIGFDQIPKDILNSKILTANDLGQLASIVEIPKETEVNEYKLMKLSDLFLSSEDANELEKKLHLIAQNLLTEEKIEEAWLTLLSFNNG
jgi:flavin reductase (DIM6/NTAB) family NADH-FMN oxidoreductase RutF